MIGDVTVEVSSVSYVTAKKLAQAFNTASRAGFKNTVEDAVAFVHRLLPDLQDGWTLVSGNPYSWDDPCLNKSMVAPLLNEIATENKLYYHPRSPVVLSRDAFDKVKDIRSAFALASDSKAADLAIKAYQRYKNGLSHHNGFYMLKNDVRKDVP